MTARRQNIIVDLANIAVAPQPGPRTRADLHTVDIAMEMVDTKFNNKLTKNVGVRVTLGDAMAIKPSAAEARSHALSTLSERARGAMNLPDCPRGCTVTVNGLIGPQAAMNPYKGRGWTYIYEVVPKTPAACTAAITHASKYMKAIMKQAYLETDLSVPATDKAGAWAALLN